MNGKLEESYVDLSQGLVISKDRHPGTRHFELLFAYAHLAGHRRTVSSHAAGLAQIMVDQLPDGPELTAGLRKLLEAKDCFVRCVL